MNPNEHTLWGDVIASGDEQQVRLALIAGLDPTQRLDEPAMSPLHMAVKAQQIAVAVALVEAGADPETGEPSALTMATQNQQWNMVWALKAATRPA